MTCGARPTVRSVDAWVRHISGAGGNVDNPALLSHPMTPNDPSLSAPPSGWQRLWGSLKTRITIGGVVALVLGIGLVTWLTVQRAETDTLRAEREREQIESARTAGLLSRRIVGLQKALQAVSMQFEPALMQDPAALDRFIASKPVAFELFDHIFVTTPEGDVRLLADRQGVQHPALSIADRDYFRRTLSEGRAMISPPLPSRVSGKPAIAFTQPVRGADGIVAVLGGALRLDSRDVLEGLVELRDGSSDTMIVVTDADGRVLAHPHAGFLTRPIADDPRLAQAFEAWTAMGSPVEPAGLLLPQTGQLVSTAGVAGPDWMVWRARPEESLLAPLRDARRDALAWAAAVIAVLSLGLLLFLWWLLQPLTLLERRITHLFDGTLPPPDGWPAAIGEIGRLSHVLRRVGMERARLEVANNEVLRRLNSVMSAAPVGIAFLRGHRFELVSPEFCRLLGHTEATLLGQPMVSTLASPDDEDVLVASESEAFGEGAPYMSEWRMKRQDGSMFWAGLRSKPVAADDMAQGTIWTLSDIDDQRLARKRLEWSAAHDPLTGLANRQTFELRARQLVEALPRSLPAVLVFIDLDRFKSVNDTAGHLMGDLMLHAVAKAIGLQVRPGDLVARLGGDEFAVLLARCNLDTGLRIAQQICDAVAAIALPWEDQSLQVGASSGVARLLPSMRSLDAWVEPADAACYAAKAAGRGTVRAAVEPTGAGDAPAKDDRDLDNDPDSAA